MFTQPDEDGMKNSSISSFVYRALLRTMVMSHAHQGNLLADGGPVVDAGITVTQWEADFSSLYTGGFTCVICRLTVDQWLTQESSITYTSCGEVAHTRLRSWKCTIVVCTARWLRQKSSSLAVCSQQVVVRQRCKYTA